MRFWRLEVPFALPQLVWNMMVSMSGGWFFVVASEAISVGNTTVTLPGIGSYIALAVERRSLGAIGWAIGAMLVVILVYDQLLFRPLVAWADRFRVEQEAGGAAPAQPWVLTMLRRRSEEHTSELQSLMSNSYDVFCLKKKKRTKSITKNQASKHRKTDKIENKHNSRDHHSNKRTLGQYNVMYRTNSQSKLAQVK